MVNTLLLGLFGTAILLATSKMGIMLSVKLKTKGLPVVIGTITLQILLIGLYSGICLAAGADELMYALSIGFGIFLDVGYKIYLALNTTHK